MFGNLCQGPASKTTDSCNDEPTAATACPSTVYKGVHLTPYYSYLYYYPTMRWNLNKTPDSENYWVGIFKKGASDGDYITYQYLKKTAQGSYKVGLLATTFGMSGSKCYEEYELRIFDGQQRLKAETNKLRGVINAAPTDPFASDASSLLVDQSKQLDAETASFIRAIEEWKEDASGDIAGGSLENINTQWGGFTSHQQQLLFPVLEQASLPDEITKPGPKELDHPEPKISFPGLGDSKFTVAAEPTDPKAPDQIVLNITLDKSYTYLYPLVNVQKEVPYNNAWMGMYYPKR